MKTLSRAPREAGNAKLLSATAASSSMKSKKS
jgi:hypothetical protein